jgi:Putative Actinobacterial Holin-X, holin superfamily III
MADTVDRAASSSAADAAEQPPDATPADQAEQPQDAAPADQAEQPRDAAPADQAEQPRDAGSDSLEDEAERGEEQAKEPQDAPSVTELLEQLGRELSELGMAETQLEAARNMPEVRRLARDVVGAVVVLVAALTAFAFVNVAAVDLLSRVLASWLAALVLAAFWIAAGGILLFGLMGRARRWLLWIVVKAPPPKALEELERERDAAGRAARSTLERLGPALAIQIALAAIPDPGDVASGVVEVGDSVLDASDEIVEELAEQLPGGGAVNQVWAVALTPGRLGIRVATTVLRRGRPAEDG